MCVFGLVLKLIEKFKKGKKYDRLTVKKWQVFENF